MIDELNAALTDYDQKWQQLIAERSNKQFFAALKPVALGWKVGDRAEYDRIYSELHDKSEKIVETWMNGRWVAKFCLKDVQLQNGITIVKVLLRRPNSDDALGMDHVDFYSPDVTNGPDILEAEPGLEWTKESNDVIAGYEWLSIWFNGTEAKLKSDTVLDIVAAELTEMSQKLTNAA